ncbi:ABC transporter C family member 8-like [Dorcoceras hygrometricum]|uniref:ABC transporter C family member 8-like n=1 Tax=Dorcoceras hygrometricum TaxID=472368 RepID=A0A2Z7DDQ1_9LAMI|nr:ABC transporter C family member 8-like [Dorcoceras hygrometricum]
MALSFDAVTSKCFDMMVVISAGIKVKWTSVLFGILIAMVATSAKQSQGFVVQLSRLLERISGIENGKSIALHPLKVLNIKSIHTYKMKNAPSISELLKERSRLEAKKKAVEEKRKVVEDSGATELQRKRLEKSKMKKQVVKLPKKRRQQERVLIGDFSLRNSQI